MDPSSSSRLGRGVMIAIGVAAATVVTYLVLRVAIGAAHWLAMPLLALTSLFLIVLVLVQRGKGGGLAGAFGGMGGQSAFGTKAGDLFTRVTMGTALFWIVLCAVTLGVFGQPEDIVDQSMGGVSPIGAPQEPSSSGSGGTTPATTPEETPDGGATPDGE